MVKICENGKLRLKKKSDIAPGWPKAGGGEIFDKMFRVVNKKSLNTFIFCRMQEFKASWRRSMQ